MGEINAKLYKKKCKPTKYYTKLELCDVVKVMVTVPEQPDCGT
jgi:hypothetical protein